MVDQPAEKTKTVTLPQTFPAGQVVAANVSAEDYMRDYAATLHEWVEGVVVKMSPISGKHDDLSGLMREFLRAYFAFRPIGRVRSAPFVMRLKNSSREPDLQIILNNNPGTLTETYMDGPADICIEIVSPSNEAVDYGDKFREYEQAGVPEYWIFDPIRRESRFHRLTEDGVYQQVALEDGKYTTPLLPGFILDTSILWRDEVPNLPTVLQMVKEMLD